MFCSLTCDTYTLGLTTNVYQITFKEYFTKRFLRKFIYIIRFSNGTIEFTEKITKETHKRLKKIAFYFSKIYFSLKNFF